MTHPTPTQIRAARLAAGLTQEAAARLALYSCQPRWAEIESGTRNIELVRWLYFLHVAGLERLPFNVCKAHRSKR